MSLDIAKLLSR